MFAIAARRMGYRVHTLSPDIDTPTGQVADVEIDADYDDLDAIRAFARGVDVITFEFENVSTAAADAAAEIVPVRPSGHALHVTSNAPARRRSCRPKGFPVTPFESVRIARRAGHGGRTASGCRRSSRPRRSATTARASTGSPSRHDLERVWGLVGHQTAVAGADGGLRPRVLGRGGARPRRGVRPLRRDREHPSRTTSSTCRWRRRACRRRRWPRRSRSRGRSWRSWVTSACSASSSS